MDSDAFSVVFVKTLYVGGYQIRAVNVLFLLRMKAVTKGKVTAMIVLLFIRI